MTSFWVNTNAVKYAWPRLPWRSVMQNSSDNISPIVTGAVSFPPSHAQGDE